MAHFLKCSTLELSRVFSSKRKRVKNENTLLLDAAFPKRNYFLHALSLLFLCPSLHAYCQCTNELLNGSIATTSFPSFPQDRNCAVCIILLPICEQTQHAGSIIFLLSHISELSADSAQILEKEKSKRSGDKKCIILLRLAKRFVVKRCGNFDWEQHSYKKITVLKQHLNSSLLEQNHRMPCFEQSHGIFRNGTLFCQNDSPILSNLDEAPLWLLAGHLDTSIIVVPSYPRQAELLLELPDLGAH